MDFTEEQKQWIEKADKEYSKTTGCDGNAAGFLAELLDQQNKETIKKIQKELKNAK